MDTVISPEKISLAWRELSAEVQKNKTIVMERFEKVFSQTYTLLSDELDKVSLDKQYVEFVSEAFLFANIKDEMLDSMCLAACVLTERMLSYCAFNYTSAAEKSMPIYVVEARKEILLDFCNVKASVLRLQEVFEEMYWKKNNL